jgi:hypothetical protein
VFALTRAPLKLFMAEPMKKIVDCWNWLLSARPDLESLFLLDMIAAWHSAQQVETSKTKLWIGIKLIFFMFLLCIALLLLLHYKYLILVT